MSCCFNSYWLIASILLFPFLAEAQDLGNLNINELIFGLTTIRNCYVCADCQNKGEPKECPLGMGAYCVETQYAPPIGPWKWDRYCYFVCPSDVGADVEPYITSKCCRSDLCNDSPSIEPSHGFMSLIPAIAMLTARLMGK